MVVICTECWRYPMFLARQICCYYSCCCYISYIYYSCYLERKRIIQCNYVTFSAKAFELWLENYRICCISGRGMFNDRCMHITFSYELPLHCKLIATTKDLIIIMVRSDIKTKGSTISAYFERWQSSYSVFILWLVTVFWIFYKVFQYVCLT